MIFIATRGKTVLAEGEDLEQVIKHSCKDVKNVKRSIVIWNNCDVVVAKIIWEPLSQETCTLYEEDYE